jgi:hypothetical protein
VLEHLGRHGDLLQVARIGRDVRAVDDERHGQRHGSAGFDLQLLDLDYVPDRDLVLLAAGLDDCVRRHRVVILYVCVAGARCPEAARVVWGCGCKCPAVTGSDHREADGQLLKIT